MSSVESFTRVSDLSGVHPACISFVSYHNGVNVAVTVRSLSGYATITWWDGTSEKGGDGIPSNDIAFSKTNNTVRAAAKTITVGATNGSTDTVSFHNTQGITKLVTPNPVSHLRIGENCFLDIINAQVYDRRLDITNYTPSFIDLNGSQFTELLFDASSLDTFNVIDCNYLGGVLDLSAASATGQITFDYTDIREFHLGSTSGGVTYFTGIGCTFLETLTVGAPFSSLSWFSFSGCSSLSSITMTGFDGVGYGNYTHGYGMDFSACNLDTDAVYLMLSGFAPMDPAGQFMLLSGNPCESGGVLQNGTTYSAAQVTALASSLSLTLVLS